MAKPRRSDEQKRLETRRGKDEELMQQLERSCDKLNNIADIMLATMKTAPLTPSFRCAELCMTAIDHHRRLAISINQIRWPKSTMFVKHQINQLAIETEQIKSQLEASKNVRLDARIERENATVDIRAETVADVYGG